MDKYGVVDKLWGFCDVLRDDGIGYGDYIEQLTYLLFLKLAEERDSPIPEGYDWESLKTRAGTELRDHYMRVLNELAACEGLLGDIFAGALSRFREPVNLKRLITMIDEIEWTEIDVDIKAAAYEGLLQKYAEEQKGAGQYFTPRELVRSIVRCMKPDIRDSTEFKIHDPACGTGGFLIGAYEWLLDQTEMGADLSRDENRRLRKDTFSGQEIVLETRRLGLMNLYLHEIEGKIEYGDSLSEGPHTSKRYDIILTNPPFGSSGGGKVERDDFSVRTSNKQVNFVQHVMTILKTGGRAAMIVPDNLLYESGTARDVRRILLEDCNLHTILRLPVGTFTPYSPGVKANVIFFSKGHRTEETWIYDLRTEVERVAKSNPLTPEIFTEFEMGFCSPFENASTEARTETKRFRRFTIQDIRKKDYRLSFRWLGDTSEAYEEALPDHEDAIRSLKNLVYILQQKVSSLETQTDMKTTQSE